MIKCNKAEVIIEGQRHVIMAECSMLLSNVKDLLTEKVGEEQARKDMELIVEAALLSDEELEAKNKEMEKEMPKEVVAVVDSIIHTLLFGGGESSPGSVEEEDKDE